MKKRLIILIPCFHDGGVETWVKSIFEYNKTFDLVLVIHGEVSMDVSFAKDVIKVKNFLEVFRAFKKLKLSKYDVVFSSLTPSNIYGLLLKFFFRYKHIVGVQVTLMKLEWESYLKFAIRKLIYKVFHFLSDRVYVASSGLKKEISKKDSKKIKVFWNPVINNSFLQEPKIPINQREKIILAVGRLEAQKDFELLIKSIYELKKITNEDFQLLIVGNGSLKKKLSCLVKNFNLESDIKFIPFSENIFDYYLKAKVFVLSSIYEGFGNVLAEALFSNCYCISYDINHGPKDILDNGRFGVLLKDRDSKILSNEIRKGLLYKQPFYVNEHQMIQFGERFTSEKYLEKMEKDINEMMNN